MGVAVCGSCGGCPCSDYFAGVFITVVVRTPVGIDFGFGPEVVGVRGCNRGRCYGCVVVLLWPFCGCFGPLGACGRCGPVGCFGPSRGCSRGGPCDCFGPLGGNCPSGEYPFWSLRRFDICGWYVCCDVVAQIFSPCKISNHHKRNTNEPFFYCSTKSTANCITVLNNHEQLFVSLFSRLHLNLQQI